MTASASGALPTPVANAKSQTPGLRLGGFALRALGCLGLIGAHTLATGQADHAHRGFGEPHYSARQAAYHWRLETSALKYLPQGNIRLDITTEAGATLMLVGGEPLGEPIVMWWNFIGRSHEDIAEARAAWNAREQRFAEFEDRIGGWIPAPELPNVRLRAR